jgi:probable F420-dependent oxidoreductase
MLVTKIDVSHVGGLRTARSVAQDAERLGADGLWTAETKHDAFLESALALVDTTRLEVMTGIVIALARSPMTIAQEATDLQDLSDGRFVLGLGSQVRTHITKRFSMPWTKPVGQMHEMIGAIRAIWAHWYEGVPLQFEGEHYRHTFNSTAFRRNPTHATPPPIHLASVGPMMTKLAANEADGFISHSFVTEEYLRKVIRPVLDAGRRGADPDFDRVVTCNVVVGSPGPELDGQLDAVRAQVALYGSTPAYLPVLELHDLTELHQTLFRMSRENRFDEMGALIDDEVLSLFCVWGEADAAADELLRRFGDDATRLRLPASASELVPVLRAKLDGKRG